MLTAGLCRVVITPPIGIGMVGFAGRGPSEGVHDDLMATVLAVSDGERGLALVALDLLYLPAGVLGQNPSGAIDRELLVGRLDGEDGSPLATIVGFACHPVCQGGRMALLSADFPGRMRAAAEGLTGSPCLFIQGAAGNINPVEMV